MAHFGTHGAKDEDAVTDVTAAVAMFGPWEATSNIFTYTFCII